MPIYWVEDSDGNVSTHLCSCEEEALKVHFFHYRKQEMGHPTRCMVSCSDADYCQESECLEFIKIRARKPTNLFLEWESTTRLP